MGVPQIMNPALEAGLLDEWVSKCASLSCRLQERSPMPAPRPGYSSAESGIESPVDRAAFDAALGEVQICLASRDRPVSQDRFSCWLVQPRPAPATSL
jgi:hypothetical protein